MSFLHRVKTFHHTVTRVHLKRRAVPLAALVLTTSMTFPVIAVGMDTYTVTDGTNTDTVVLHESNARPRCASPRLTQASTTSRLL